MNASAAGDRDIGAAGVDAAMAVTALLAMSMLVIGGLRITNASGDVQAAARSAARAAAAEYQPSAAEAAASQVASVALADRGQSCRQLDVDVQGDLSAGSVVTVIITCTVGSRRRGARWLPGIDRRVRRGGRVRRPGAGWAMNPRTERDRGSIMPMTTIFIGFLMLATWSLISASQQWGAPPRRLRHGGGRRSCRRTSRSRAASSRCARRPRRCDGTGSKCAGCRRHDWVGGRRW